MDPEAAYYHTQEGIRDSDLWHSVGWLLEVKHLVEARIRELRGEESARQKPRPSGKGPLL